MQRFPIGKSLLSKGASITNIVIILSSWAVIKVPMLANEAKFLGSRFHDSKMDSYSHINTDYGILDCRYCQKERFTRNQNQRRRSRNLLLQEEYCVGCGVCSKMAPEIYEIQDNKGHC